jgi:hypothetical protein
MVNTGVNIYVNKPPPQGGGMILADVTWGEKYEKGEDNKGQM